MSVRFFQAQVVDDPGYRGAVEASVMRTAYGVLQEDDSAPDSAVRKSAAAAVFRGYGSVLDRFIRLFAWYAVFHPDIQRQVFDPDAKRVTPERLDDATLDRLVAEFWSMASGFEQEGEV